MAFAAWPFRAELAPVPRADPALYAQAAVSHGAVLAALGNCAVCHGPDLAGGYRLQTPFGTITTPNITPDEATGIGGWSYAAFARAMRDGIGRDGRQLYPALPYTHFRTVTEPDLQALYAFLVNQPAVAAPRGRERHALPVQPAPAARRLERAVFFVAAPSSPTRHGQANGTAAPTWWTG